MEVLITNINVLIWTLTVIGVSVASFTCGMLWVVKAESKPKPTGKTLLDMTLDERKTYFDALEFEVVCMRCNPSMKILMLTKIKEFREEYLSKERPISEPVTWDNSTPQPPPVLSGSGVEAAVAQFGDQFSRVGKSLKKPDPLKEELRERRSNPILK